MNPIPVPVSNPIKVASLIPFSKKKNISRAITAITKYLKIVIFFLLFTSLSLRLECTITSIFYSIILALT